MRSTTSSVADHRARSTIDAALAEPPPYTHAEFKREVIDRQIDKLVERGVWKRPARDE